MRSFLFFLFSAFTGFINPVKASFIHGCIVDQVNNRPIDGASVDLPPKGHTFSTGDGSFTFSNVTAGRHLLIIRVLNYKTDTVSIVVGREQVCEVTIRLQPVIRNLQTLTIQSGSAAAVREKKLENASASLLQIISRPSITLSSDITVADMMPRISGVSVLRNENGTAGKALIRGMDPKYIYTTVNGMPIPSPDDKNRFLSLDLFPASIIEQVEVYKTPTAEMAADAIGGLINIVTQLPSAHPAFSFQFASGYNQMYLNKPYLSFNDKVVQFKSPYELKGTGYNASGNDFTKENLIFKDKRPLPDLYGNLSWSRRFLKQKLGFLAEAGLQTIHSGSNGFLILQNNEPQLNNKPGITDFIKRDYYATSQRKNLYLSVDYQPNAFNKLRLYNLFINKLDIESRQSVDTSLSEGRSGPGTGRIALMQRSRMHLQNIESINLAGDHQLSPAFILNWNTLYTIAKGNYPDWSELTANTGRILGANGQINQTPLLLAPLNRLWIHNTEKEFGSRAAINATKTLFNQRFDLLAGGQLLFKTRDNFYNNYVFQPAITQGNGQPFTGIEDAVWLNNNGPQNPQGTVNTPGTYHATEDLNSWYLQVRTTIGKAILTTGLRNESTHQVLLSAADPSTFYGRRVKIQYQDWLPSIHLQYAIDNQQDLKLTYFKAINRPSLYDLTFFNMAYDDYSIAGNPFLKRSIADNIDLQYTLYAPGLIDQLQLTAFYKNIQDPFEKTLINIGDTLYPMADGASGYTPASGLTEQLRNYGTAVNYGFELTMEKEINPFHIVANYTFTTSQIEQTKKYKQRIDPLDPASDIITVSRPERRPLQGQSPHLLNLNIGYNLKGNWTFQLVGTYTGKRIHEVSGWYGLDNWEKPTTMLDFSLQKFFKSRWRIFAKATNILNAGNRIYIKGSGAGIAEQNENGKIIIENEKNGRQFMMGVAYKM